MKIIFFSSHTAIWYFAIAEATIASALQKCGHDVLFVTPGNLFSGVSNLKQEIILREEFSLNGYELAATLTEEDRKEIGLVIKKLNRNNFEQLVIDDIEIGKIALYEFLLHSKKMSVKLSKDEWKECINYLKNTLTSFFACRRIIKNEKPDRIMMYGELYSVNRVWDKYAQQKNIPVYYLQNGLNFSDMDDTLVIAKTTTFDFIRRLINIWSKVKDFPVGQKELAYVTDNFYELLKAKHFLVYSSPKSKKQIDIREKFDIDEDRKILTATMSSYDEYFAARYVDAWQVSEKVIFKSQVEWIKALIKYAKNKSDIFLIIRVHPREFPNKRESLKSEHAKMLENIFKKLPSNVRINWPTDNISIYDLAQETNVFLNAWSSVGVEMSLLGIPVVLYAKDLVLYPPDLNYIGKSKKDYFCKVEQALHDGWSYEKIKSTYRWLALFYYRTIMRLRKKKTEFDRSLINKIVVAGWSFFYSLLSPKVRGLLIKIFLMIPGLGIGKRQRNDCKQRLNEHVDISGVEKMLLNSEDTLVDIKSILNQHISKSKEDLYIRKEIKRIYKAMYEDLLGNVVVKKDSLQYNLKQIFT